MSLPLFKSPASIVFLDDDQDYLDMLSLVLPRSWSVQLFLRPQDFVRHLLREVPRWDADVSAQQQVIAGWRKHGEPLIPHVLRYWARGSDRFGLSQVCVVDYSMPAMNGLQALSALGDWPGMRVLLTGQADEQIALEAFNEGLIDQFIPKQSPDIGKRLVDALLRLQGTASGRQTQIWRATLTPQQSALLRVPAIAHELVDLVARHWVEHVVLGDPFGILGRDASGRISWLQLEPASGLDELADLAEGSTLSVQEVDAVREGRQLANFDLRRILGLASDPELQPAFAIGSEDEGLLGALFRVTDDVDSSYQHWFAQQPKREVRE